MYMAPRARKTCVQPRAAYAYVHVCMFAARHTAVYASQATLRRQATGLRPFASPQRSVPFATCTHMWRLSHVHFAVAKPRPQQIAKRDRLYSNHAHDRRRGDVHRTRGATCWPATQRCMRPRRFAKTRDFARRLSADARTLEKFEGIYAAQPTVTRLAPVPPPLRKPSVSLATETSLPSEPPHFCVATLRAQRSARDHR